MVDGFVLEINRLSKVFGETTAVNELDLAIPEGEFLVLLGPSGCGKSTTLRILAGFEEPSSGTISLDGNVISRRGYVVPPERRQMGMIFQSYAVWPHMTVRENVAFGPRLRGRRGAQLDEIVSTALRTVQIDQLAHRFPAELSGGQQQRVALARALASEPRILLMDEPLSNLDAKLRYELRDELRRVHNELGLTAIYVTHDQAEAMALGDRIVVMNHGRVQQLGVPSELYKQPANEFVAGFLGRANRIPGRMVDDNRVTVGSVSFPCSHAADVRAGQDVIAIVRPTAFQVVESRSTNRHVLDCMVEALAFLGETQECSLHIPAMGCSVSASFPPFVEIRAGMRLSCSVEGVAAVRRDDMDGSTEQGHSAE